MRALVGLRCLAGLLSIGCHRASVRAGMPDGAVTPEVHGVLRPGDPYGRPTETLPGWPVALAVGASASRCENPVYAARTDNGGRFVFPPVRVGQLAGPAPARPDAMTWWVCAGVGSEAPADFPMYRGQGLAGRRLALECEIHGDAGSPLCERRR